jgi:hypothetical protein
MNTMLSGDVIGKRLAMIRYLFDLGDRERAGQFPAVAVLCFHDALEMFLQLGLEHHSGETKDRAEFLQLFDALKANVGALGGRDGLVRVNSVRIAVKHKAIDISSEEVMRCYERTRDFLAQNSVPVFGIDIFAAALSDRLADDKVRDSVKAAEAALQASEFLESVKQAAIAFDSISRQSGITAIGIAPDRLARFKSLTPSIQTAVSGKQTIISRRSNATKEECEFCIKFVVDVAAAIERRAQGD